MPAFCAIVNCSNRHGRDNKSFFRLPKVIEHQGDKTRELSKERRDKWWRISPGQTSNLPAWTT